MKLTLGFVGFTWLVSIIWGLKCSDYEYPSEWKCCQKCRPGYELEKRCQPSADTKCEPCDEGYYNDIYTYSRCKRCSVCEKDSGLQEVKPCEKHSNALCACLPGYSEVAGTDEKRCDPCPNGYFSKGGTDKCQPWRNCTAEGKRTLRPGKREEDAICDDHSSIPEGSTTILLPFHPPQEKVTPTIKLKSTHASLTTHPEEHKSTVYDLVPMAGSTYRYPGFVVIFIIGAVLLLVAGGSVLLLFFWTARKQRQELEGPELLSGLPREEERSSYRIPIQEEQMDSKSSFVQN